MILAEDFLKYLKLRKFTFFSGVPCSLLKKLIEVAVNDSRIKYIPAVRENLALGLASGAYLARKKSGILIQNSGLGNIINVLTSFNLIYKIPVLMIISWRGYRGKDAPQHSIIGRKTIPILSQLGVPHRVLGNDYKTTIDWAVETMKRRSIPVAVILKKGTVK